MKYPSLKISMLLALGAVAPLHAALFTTTTSATGGQDWNQTTAGWTPGNAAPTAGNTYEAVSNGSSTNQTLVRTPNNSATVTFPGDSLKISTGAGLRLKNNTGGPGPANSTYTFNTGGLILNGGQLQMGDGKAGGLTYTVAGAVHVTAASAFSNRALNQALDTPGNPAPDPRTLLISATMDGSGSVTMMNGSTSITSPTAGKLPDFDLTGNNSSFSGGFVNQGGWLRVAGINSLGTGNLSIAGFNASNQAVFSSTLDLVSTGAFTLNANSGFILNHNLTFSTVSFNGSSLAAGSYNNSQLTTLGYGAFIASGSDAVSLLTVTAVPEPSSTAAVVVAGLAIVLIMRRRRA